MQVLTHFPILKALGWALFNSMWQMAALWMLYVLLVAVFQNASVRHRLALLLLGAGALWTGVSFFAAWLLPGNPGSSILSILVPSRPLSGGFWESGHRMIEVALPYASSLYLLVLGGLVVRYCANYRHSRNLTRLGLSTLPPQFRTFVSSTASQLNIRVPVKAWLSSLIDVPLTLGFLKPVILLPAAMITHLTPQQVEAILIHELAHIKRKDYLLHLLVTLMEGLFFFNPFARLLIRQLKKERENCCDDLVLQFKYDPHAYVSALLSLASRHQPLHRLALAATGTGDRMLLQRAKRILLRRRSDRLRPGARSLIMLIFTLAVTALTVYHPLLQPRKTSPAIAIRTNTVYRIHPGVPAVAGIETTTFLAPASPRFPSTAMTETGHPAVAPMATPRHLAHTRTTDHHTHATIGIARLEIVPGSGDNFFVNTADDDGFAFGNAGGVPAAVVPTAGQSDNTATPDADNRDFSMDIPQVAGAVGGILQGTTFIPNSSFSYQYTLNDSTHPEEQLLYLQQSAQLEVLDAIAKLNQQTTAQLNALSTQLTKASESVRLRKDIRIRQMQIRQDYFRKILMWQNKLEKTTHVKMIVYI